MRWRATRIRHALDCLNWVRRVYTLQNFYDDAGSGMRIQKDLLGVGYLTQIARKR